jgi:hypothetical protein
MRQRLALWIPMTIVALLVAARARAQERGSINGLVQDASSGVNAVMEVGSVEETITVTGASPVVDVQGTQTQFVANKQVLEALASARTSPSQPYGAAVLVPGVILYRPQGGLNVMTVHGSANGDQRITFEGMSIGQILSSLD